MTEFDHVEVTGDNWESFPGGRHRISVVGTVWGRVVQADPETLLPGDATMRAQLIFRAAALTLCAISAEPASALSMKECSAKYSAAKQAGTLNGEKWNDFRKAECSATASAATTSPAAATTPAAPAPAPVTRTAAPAASAPVAPRQTVAAAPTGPVPYPSAVDPKYSSESAGKARMHTCLDSYKAAKASNTLGGSKWIEKGGGYYSACNTKLKGA